MTFALLISVYLKWHLPFMQGNDNSLDWKVFVSVGVHVLHATFH